MSNTEETQTLTSLTCEDTQKVIDALPSGVRSTLYSFPTLFVAGGFIRAVLAGEEIKDVDIFTSELGTVDRAAQHYIHQCQALGHTMTEHETPCTITVKGEGLPVQFVNNAEYTISQALKTFDFTICQAAIWFDSRGWNTCCTPEFIRDVAERRLVYTTPERVEAPGGSLWRAFKYAKRGYTITQEELARLVVRLNEGLDSGEIEANPWTHFKRKTHQLGAVRGSFAMRGKNGAVMGGDY